MSVMTRLLGAALVATALVSLLPRRVHAHCDTMSGPTVADGRRALETGDAKVALKWVDEEREGELTAAFDLARRVRDLGPDAHELADRYFLETLVRLHRAGEGEPYAGIQPVGTPIDARVAAADQCIADENLGPLEPLVAASLLPELRARFERVLETKDFDPDDLAAGRAYIAAYVSFFHLAEGEHEHARAEHPSTGDGAGHNHVARPTR